MPAPAPPLPPPSPTPACVSGDATVINVQNESRELVEVRDLQRGDLVTGVHGLDISDSVVCVVEGIGSFGNGTVYGNYTHDHFMINTTTMTVEPHGMFISNLFC